MAALGRESRLMPTVKCSTCGLQVEISLMGDHICTGGSGSPVPESTPPLPAASLFGRLMPSFGNPLAQKQQPRAPPSVDTSAANRAFINQGQLTPISMSSGSQDSISPQTPVGRPDAVKADEFFSPQIANNSPPPPQPRTPGGYGGLDEKTGYEEPSAYQTSPPKKQPPNLAERMNNMNNMGGPFGRRPSGAGPGNANDRRPSTATGDRRPSAVDRPGTSASNVSSGFGSGRSQKPPQRLNGYGGFGAPETGADSAFEPPVTPNRAETFPRPNDRFAPPPRTPSAPPASATLRPDRLRPPMNSPGQPEQRSPMTSERNRRPSRGGPDMSRPPPPRNGSTVRPTTPGVPTINLAEEFGIGNPYHAPSESTSSSSNSENGGSQPKRRPSQASQASQASSRTSPPRSIASRSGRNPSDPSDFDSLMSDIQASMKPDPTTIPLKLPPRDMRDLPSPLSASRGYDPRIDPAILNPRSTAAARGRLPSATPDPGPPPPPQQQQQQQQPQPKPKPKPLDNLVVQIVPDALVPGSPGQLSPRWTSSPERADEPPRSPVGPPPRLQQQQQQQQPPQKQQQQSPPRAPTRTRSNSRPLNPPAPPQQQQQQQPPSSSSRGNCKSCALPIKGKSISSADGRLTGRYHKPCFVCTTCREPFASATFYVLDDRPYCELHYHVLNGSLCGSCGRGIEGQYLEDEARVKHHVGCFKCGECGMALRDGYFEVGGKAYCEKDAWRLAGGGGPQMGMGMGMGGGGGPGLRPPMMGLPGGPRMGGGGGYNPSRLGPGAMGRPRMEKRMTRLGMM